jgi:hypothetical protein
MIFRRHDRQRAPLILAAGIALTGLCLGPADAQTPPSSPPAYLPWQSIVPSTEAAPDPADAEEPEADGKEPDNKAADSKDANTEDGKPVEDGKPAETSDASTQGLELDWSQLNVDPSTFTKSPDAKSPDAKSLASKARAASPNGSGSETSWSSSDKGDGSSAVTVKRSLSNFLDTRVGADMTVARPPQTLTESQLLANGGSLPQSSGTAWAAITAPGVGSIWDKTAVEARLDPTQEQSKLGTSLSKSLPLSDRYSLSFQNGYSLVEQGVIPVPGIIGRPVRNYETDQSAKLSIAETGTSFTAGQALSSTDDKWLRKVGAEQKLFGGVSISGSIGETSLGTTNKSLTAGFKQSW